MLRRGWSSGSSELVPAGLWQVLVDGMWCGRCGVGGVKCFESKDFTSGSLLHTSVQVGRPCESMSISPAYAWCSRAEVLRVS